MGDPGTTGMPSAHGPVEGGSAVTADRGTPPAPSSAPALQRLADSLPDDRSRTRILVVDDTGLDRERLKDELSGEGYRVTTAQDGEEALAKVAAEAPDLILLDVIMPKLDGYEVCRLLKSDGRTILIPVVLITSLQATEERIRGIEAGADDFLSKPFNRQELTLNIRAAGDLYKKLTDATEGYVGDVPIIHQAVAVKAAIDALDASFQEDRDGNF